MVKFLGDCYLCHIPAIWGYLGDTFVYKLKILCSKMVSTVFRWELKEWYQWPKLEVLIH